MKYSKKLAQVGAIGALAVFGSFSAYAQSNASSPDYPSESARRSWVPFTTNGYVGGSIGQTDYDFGGCTPGFSCDDGAMGFKVFTGGWFTRGFGMEGGYFHLGDVDRNGGRMKAQGANLSLVGAFPVGDTFSILGKVGAQYAWTDTTSGVPGARTGKQNDLGLSLGAGMQFDFTPSMAMRLEWDRYRVKYVGQRVDADLYSVGFAYKF